MTDNVERTAVSGHADTICGAAKCCSSPTALHFLKMAMNADCDGQAGMMAFTGSATLRPPDFSKLERYP